MLRETSSLRTKSFDEEFQTAQGNPQHPSLHFKKVGRFWSARAGIDYRALSVADGDDPIWVWIGSHDEYKKIIKEDV